jgi:DNA polymerase-3 subunit delta
MSLAELKKQIREKKHSSVYIFYGEEDYLKRHHFLSLKKALIDQEFEDFNFNEFDGKNLDFSSLYEAAERLPVFAPLRMIVITDFLIKKDQAQINEEMCYFLKNIPDYLCVVFYYLSESYGPDRRLKVTKTLEALALAVNFMHPKEGELRRWIVRHLEANHKKMKKETLDYFLSVCSPDMHSLSTELQKLCAYTVVREIEIRQIDAIVSKTFDTHAFELTKALVSDQGDSAYRIITKLLADGEEPIMIMGAISKTFRDLYTIKAVSKDNRSAGSIRKMVKLPSNVFELYLRLVRQYSLSHFANCMEECIRADRRLKLMKGLQTQFIFEELLSRILLISKEMKKCL